MDSQHAIYRCNSENSHLLTLDVLAVRRRRQVCSSGQVFTWDLIPHRLRLYYGLSPRIGCANWRFLRRNPATVTSVDWLRVVMRTCCERKAIPREAYNLGLTLSIESRWLGRKRSSDVAVLVCVFQHAQRCGSSKVGTRSQC